MSYFLEFLVFVFEVTSIATHTLGIKSLKKVTVSILWKNAALRVELNAPINMQVKSKTE